MANVYLHLLQDGGDSLLSIRTEDEKRRLDCTPVGARYRTSPIFPVMPGEGRTPQPDEDYFIGFFCFEGAFSVIGRLLGEIPRDLQSGMWFSNGLASLVLFSKDVSIIEQVRTTHGPELRAYEMWSVTKGRVASKDLWVAAPAAIPSPMPRVTNYSALPREQVLILDELTAALNVAIERSAQYMPDRMGALIRLIPAVNDIVAELQFLIEPDRFPPPPAFSEAAATKLRAAPTQRQKMVHQRTGDLVQIAASLSAANTQAFSGAFPILSPSVSPVGTHSLLGIGAAYRALSGFSEFMEGIFQKYPVAKVIRNNYGTPSAVDIFPVVPTAI